MLELVDVAAERWLGDVQPLGRFRDAERVGHGNERPDMSKVHTRADPIPKLYTWRSNLYWTVLPWWSEGYTVRPSSQSIDCLKASFPGRSTNRNRRLRMRGIVRALPALMLFVLIPCVAQA